MVGEELPEPRAVLRHPLPRLEVLIEQRQREILQVDQGDLGTGIPGRRGGDGHELLVVGFAAEAAGESQDSRCHRSCSSFIVQCPSNFKLYLEVSSATQSAE